MAWISSAVLSVVVCEWMSCAYQALPSRRSVAAERAARFGEVLRLGEGLQLAVGGNDLPGQDLLGLGLKPRLVRLGNGGRERGEDREVDRTLGRIGGSVVREQLRNLAQRDLRRGDPHLLPLGQERDLLVDLSRHRLEPREEVLEILDAPRAGRAPNSPGSGRGRRSGWFSCTWSSEGEAGKPSTSLRIAYRKRSRFSWSSLVRLLRSTASACLSTSRSCWWRCMMALIDQSVSRSSKRSSPFSVAPSG